MKDVVLVDNALDDLHLSISHPNQSQEQKEKSQHKNEHNDLGSSETLPEGEPELAGSEASSVHDDQAKSGTVPEPKKSTPLAEAGPETQDKSTIDENSSKAKNTLKPR